ncbi:MAG: FMN-binding protein [Firmicutes bacterium]|nr:FMN-binding protein [Bacillota bacterium]
MDKKDIKFIIIGIAALVLVLAAANSQKNANPGQQTPSAQSTENDAADDKTTEQAADQQPVDQQTTDDQAVSGQVEQTEAPSKYTDGTYEGTATGKNPGIKVTVTISNDKITDITIISSNDNEEYFDEAAAVIPSCIIEAQSTDVDTVSGATLSSNGIIKAVEDAISKAVKQ